MSYRPQRTFNGTQGNPSTDTMGPEQLSHDIDELCKMFNPTSIHSDGSAGGVTADNLNFTGLDINEIGGVASGDIKAIRVKMNGDIEYTTDGETYHPAFAREANYLPLAGGTMSGTLNMNNNKITNLATPEVGSDPATKNYTDAIRTALEVALALKAPIDSPTFTGTPTAPTPSTEDSSTQIATTAFTQAVAAGVAGNTYSKADADAKFETIANANKLVKDVSYNSETGTFTIVTQDGTTTSIDTNIEKIPVSVSIIQSGSTYKLRITNEDGSYSECDVSAMFNAITFVDSTEITFTETTNQDGSKNVTASIKPGSIVGSKLDPDYKDILDALVDRAETAETNAQNSADNAADSATAAAGSASAASSSASAAASSVTSASQYASAAEGFKNQASNSATAAASSATEAATSASNASTSETNAAASASSAATSASNAATSASDAASDAQRTQELTNEAMEYATDAAGSQIDAETAARNAAASASTASTKASQAATSASNASTSETNAANSATAAAASAASVGTQASDAEAAARGTRNGVPVGPDDEFYHDNAEYYKDQAASIVGPQQPKITATGILKGEGDGVVSAAVAGTDYQAPLPSQSGQSGKFLTTDGSALSWDSVDALPSQTGQSGKFLTTDGTAASWSDTPMIKGVDYVTAGRAEGYPLGESATAEGVYVIAIGQGSHAEGAWSESSLNIKITGALNATTLDWDYGQRQGRLSYAPGQLIEYSEHLTDDYNEDIIHFSRITSIDFENKKLYLESPLVPDSSESVTAKYMGVITPSAGGDLSHSEGYNSRALGLASHAEGSRTRAFGDYSHAEGDNSSTYGLASHAEGATAALGAYQHTFGKNNIYDYKNIAVQGGYNGRKLGDINADGLINQEDLDLVNAHLSGQSTITDPTSLVCADIDGDGEITQSDADELERFIDSSEGTLWDRMYDLNGDWTALRFPETKTIQWQFTFTPRDVAADTIEDIKSDYAEIVSFSVSSNQVTLIAKDLPILSPQFFLYLNTEYDPNYAGEYIEVVGNGLAYEGNARTLDWLGNEVLAGKLTVGTDPTENMDVATKQYVDSKEVPPEIFWVHLTDTYDSQTDTYTYTADKTISDIYTASESGMLPIVTMGINFYILSFRYAYNATMQMYFARPLMGSALAYCTAVSTRGVDQWTVSSVNLVDSPSFTGTPTAPTPTSSSAATQIATKEYVDTEIAGIDALPSQTGQSGKFLTTNGTEASWADNPPDIFWVNVESERDSTTGTITYTANKTALEIWAAIGEGKLPIVIIRDFQYCIYTSGSYNDGILALYFYCNFGQPYDLRVRFLYNRSTGNETVSVDKVDPEVFLVTATTSNGTITADKTYAEILAAYNAGKICVVNFDNSHVCPLMYISSTGASFCKTATTSDGAYQRDVSVTNADVWNTTVVPLQTRTTASGILKGNGSGTITAAVAGTDYAAASHNHDIENLTNFSSRVYDATISRTKNTVLAAPNGSNGAATFRALVAADIPANLETFEVALWGLGTTAQPYTADKTFAQILAASTAGKIVVLRYGQTQTNNYVDYYPLVYRSTSAIRFSRTNMSGESGFSVSSSDAWSKTAGDSVQTIASDAVDSAINRTTTVNAADTNYTTYMARGEALNSADTNPTKNGTISWTYA